jgi:hypothetical protein
VLIGALVAGGMLFSAGAAMAISGGDYSPKQQDCTPDADANNAGDPGSTVPNPEPGCHNFQVTLQDGRGEDGTRYGEAGLDQLPRGYPDTGFLFGVGQPGSPNFPHSGCASFNTNGENGGPGVGCGTGTGLGGYLAFDIYDPAATTFIPATGTPDSTLVDNTVANGLNFYMGADDNLDAGEHDGVNPADPDTNQMVNGPSDGGAVNIYVKPAEAGTAPTLWNPLAMAGASLGSCADNVCEDVTTYRHSVYEGGGGSGPSREVYDYSGKHWDPENCSSGSAGEEDNCDDPNTPEHEVMNDYRAQEASNVYAEPGVQVYGDPDAQSSPIGPYPLPSAYVGTCGAAANGQVLVNTGC